MNHSKLKRYISALMVMFMVLFCMWAIGTSLATVSSATEADDIEIEARENTLTMTLHNTAAISKYRWETVGWYITLSPIASTSTTVQDYRGEKVEIFYNDTYNNKQACKKQEKGTTSDGKTKTYYEFDEEYIKSKFSGIDFTNPETTTYLYLHGIFQTYYLDSNGNKIIDSGYIYDWYDIVNYQFPGIGGWSQSSTKSDFYKYYNNKVQYDPGPQPIQVYYEYEYLDAQKDSSIELIEETSKNIKASFSHTAPTQKIKGNSTFEYANKVKAFRLSNGTSLASSSYNIASSSGGKKITASVPYGGLKFIVTYKEQDSLETVKYTKEYGKMVNDEFKKISVMKRGTLGNARKGELFSWRGKVSSQYIWDGVNGADADNQTGDDVYELFGYYVSYADGTEDAIYESPPSTLKDIMEGSDTVPEGGMTVHFLYRKYNYDKHKVSYVREWQDGTVFDSGIIGLYNSGETYRWSVKKKIVNLNGTWVERNSGSGSNFYTLIQTKITEDATGHKITDSATTGQLYSGNVVVKPLGITIHYIYQGNGPGVDQPPTPTPQPTIPAEVVPESQTVSKDFNTPTVIGEIRADDRGSEKFNVATGVATTESLYVEVKGTKYLLGYTFTKKVGIATYQIPVEKTYTLVWSNALGTQTNTEEYTQRSTVTINRAYGYWEITQLDYYTINSATVSNYSLPDGTVTITAKDRENPIPTLSYNHSSTLTDHVITPIQVTQGVRLTGGVINGGRSKPSYPNDDLTYEVNNLIDKVSVKNDYLSFNGNVVISNALMQYDTGSINASGIYQTTEMCNENVLYKNDYIIDAVKLNGTYNSNGSIYYRNVASVNSNYYGLISYPIAGLNTVTIHTPVLCNPIVTADNDKYVQLINPTNDCTQLVLDQDATLNDFTVYISNWGSHSYKQGYYTRDFSYNLHGGGDASYIQTKNGVLRNEVKFPFDVYMYKADGTKTYVAKNTWIVIGRSTVKFHLPMWVDEGVHTVDCRTVAVNCDDSSIGKTEYFRNASLINYVATNTFKIEVSGRIYGMNLYDLTDYPIWEEVFRENQSLQLKINDPRTYESGVNKNNYSKNFIYNYTTGTKDQYGNSTDRLSKYTFPLVNGSHPFYKNVGVLKKGYAVRFSLDTIGNLYSDACKVVIKPSFWFVDRKGQNRTQVDLYYSEDIAGKSRKLVKVGSSLDLINLKQIRTGDVYLGIPKAELKNTASLKNTTYKKFVSQVEAMYSFGNIKLNHAFRTFVNQTYSKSIFNSSNAAAISAKGITSADTDIRKQRWYGEYYIPGTAMAVKSGYDVYDYADKYGVNMRESFWLTDGYIIVNYDIYTVDQNGNQRLSYTNANNYLNNGNCCMWVMEGYQLQKTDHKDTTFSFKIGDVIMYDAEKKVNDDYVVGGTH